MVKNLPAMQETRVQSLGQEDPLEKEMATRSSILAWRIPWTEEPDRLHGVTRVRHDSVTKPPPIAQVTQKRRMAPVLGSGGFSGSVRQTALGLPVTGGILSWSRKTLSVNPGDVTRA